MKLRHIGYKDDDYFTRWTLKLDYGFDIITKKERDTTLRYVLPSASRLRPFQNLKFNV